MSGVKGLEKYSNVGVNKFKDFSLDSGHIANIQFGKLQTVANLVENKISINGTVNALRDGKIGGNLYFLSPNGIAVGSTGVINAGSFTGMVVDKDYFNKLSKMDSANDLMIELSPSRVKYNNDNKKELIFKASSMRRAAFTFTQPKLTLARTLSFAPTWTKSATLKQSILQRSLISLTKKVQFLLIRA
ncbi:MAG: leukotoxin LktA family filamentous adhesin [Selenomonadaceae bacterium]|nr:leukotoxin LktA family filamentous adhesin [Selenomonadaceae bacterium]